MRWRSIIKCSMMIKELIRSRTQLFWGCLGESRCPSPSRKHTFTSRIFAWHSMCSLGAIMRWVYDAFWHHWSMSQQYWLGSYTQQPGMFFPMLAVRWVQLRVSLWLAQQAMENAPLEVPNFAELLNHIRLHMPREPSLTSQYYNTHPNTQAVVTRCPQAAAAFKDPSAKPERFHTAHHSPPHLPRSTHHAIAWRPTMLCHRSP
jgi:hypothetical protein